MTDWVSSPGDRGEMSRSPFSLPRAVLRGKGPGKNGKEEVKKKIKKHR